MELATLNLAIRDLRYRAYPKVIRDDFFRVKPSKLGEFDAVVGNPPYTRQEEIDDIIPGEKETIYKTLAEDYGKDFEVSKRSSLYAYVFYHSGVFLKEGGYLGFITSNSYLDTDYGIDLQRWMLDRFKIIAVIDSKVERFFPSADVNTCITILQKESDEGERNSNTVRFVYLKKKLDEVIAHFDGVDNLRDFIERAEEFFEDEYLRIKPIRQVELYNHTKWGVFLRAGDVYWRIMEKTEWIPLKEVADVRRGFTTGDNDFFYLEDITESFKEDALPVVRNLTKDIGSLEDVRGKGLRVVRNGYDELWLIEKELLKPIVKSPREIQSYVIRPEELRYKVLYFGMRDRFENTGEYVEFVRKNFLYAWKYIKWGEKEGIHSKPTCASRNPWWDLGDWKGADALWFAGYNERFFVPINPKNILEDKRFYGISLSKGDTSLCIYLNSYLSAEACFVLSRVNFGEGATELTVYEVETFPVPKDFSLPEEEKNRLLALLESSVPLSVFKEIGTSDPEDVDLSKVAPHRLEIDRAVLKAIGFEDEEIPEVLKELYSELIDLVKSRLERARSVSNRSGKNGGFPIDYYVEKLEELINESGMEVKKTYSFVRKLQNLIREEITNDKKMTEKILKAFWIKHFGKALSISKLGKETQGGLF